MKVNEFELVLEQHLTPLTNELQKTREQLAAVRESQVNLLQKVSELRQELQSSKSQSTKALLSAGQFRYNSQTDALESESSTLFIENTHWETDTAIFFETDVGHVFFIKDDDTFERVSPFYVEARVTSRDDKQVFFIGRTQSSAPTVYSFVVGDGIRRHSPPLDSCQVLGEKVVIAGLENKDECLFSSNGCLLGTYDEIKIFNAEPVRLLCTSGEKKSIRNEMNEVIVPECYSIWADGYASGVSDYYVATLDKDKNEWFVFHKSGQKVSPAHQKTFARNLLTNHSEFFLIMTDAHQAESLRVLHKSGADVTDFFDLKSIICRLNETYEMPFDLRFQVVDVEGVLFSDSALTALNAVENGLVVSPKATRH